MLAKIGVLIFLIGLAFGIFRLMSRARALTGGSGNRARQQQATKALAPCPRCGTYVPDGICDCDKPS